jgi:dimeric dUTPase (all-alpha-NTP-PPase superfamily)
MRAFTKLRTLMASHKDLRRKIESMEKKYDEQFHVVFEAIKQLLESPKKQKRQIGFGRDYKE